MMCVFVPLVARGAAQVAKWYNLVIFTASIREYGDPVIDFLDQGRGLFQRRLFRESCTCTYGIFVKDLAVVDPDLSRVLLLDNSPGAYLFHQGAVDGRGWSRLAPPGPSPAAAARRGRERRAHRDVD